MIDVKQAVQAAIDSARTFYDKQQFVDLALEEVELSEDERFWLITLGFIMPDLTPVETNTIVSLLQARQKYERKYKVFKVNTDTGHVVSMKIRQI